MDFWKCPFMQCVTALEVNENILQSFKSESVCIKLYVACTMLLSLKTKSDSWIIETNLQADSCWRQHETLAYCRPTCWSFCVGLNENANSFFATRCHFWSSKNSGFPGNVVHKAALRSQTLLYQAWNKNETNRTNHCRLASGKGVVWKMNR